MAQGTAFAQLPLDPDEEIARRRFARGSEHYAAGAYQQALDEFEAVRRYKPAPALDYNIARCLDRLERPREAIDAYTRYVTARPDAQDAAEVRARIETLRRRLPPEPPATPPPTPTPPIATTPPPTTTTPPPPLVDRPSTARRYAAPIAVGAGALAAALVGAGLLGSVRSDYNAANGPGGCRPCTDADIAPLERRAYAGYAMLGIAGALAVVDIALFATTARRRGGGR